VIVCAGQMPPDMDTLQEPSNEIPVNPATASVNNPLSSALEEQRQEHLQQIQILQQKLQEQQRINEQQQQQLHQQQQISAVPGMPGMEPVPQELPPAYEAPQQLQVVAENAAVVTTEAQGSSLPPPTTGQPKFQLQPEVFAQIQALTGSDFFSYLFCSKVLLILLRSFCMFVGKTRLALQ